MSDSTGVVTMLPAFVLDNDHTIGGTCGRGHGDATRVYARVVLEVVHDEEPLVTFGTDGANGTRKIDSHNVTENFVGIRQSRMGLTGLTRNHTVMTASMVVLVSSGNMS